MATHPALVPHGFSAASAPGTKASQSTLSHIRLLNMTHFLSAQDMIEMCGHGKLCKKYCLSSAPVCKICDFKEDTPKVKNGQHHRKPL